MYVSVLIINHSLTLVQPYHNYNMYICQQVKHTIILVEVFFFFYF